MNKKILALCAFMLLAVVLSAQTVQTKKQKIKRSCMNSFQIINGIKAFLPSKLKI